MSGLTQTTETQPVMTQRELELSGIISAYNQVTEQLKITHEKLRDEVSRLREELVRKNQQLRRRERLAALGELAAGVAHEIRNPLGGIRLFASLLERDLAGQDKPLELVRKMVRGIGVLESLVSDILDYGRPADPCPEKVTLEPLVLECVELAQARRAGRNVRVTVDPRFRGQELISDGGLLRRALLNLLLNAIEAASEGGHEVQVSMKSGSPEWVVLSICDNGPGIPAELLDRIFNPFFTTRSDGTGLGLAIVHQIAETLGGSVQVANNEEGGAAFSLALPRTLGQEAL